MVYGRQRHACASTWTREIALHAPGGAALGQTRQEPSTPRRTWSSIWLSATAAGCCSGPSRLGEPVGELAAAILADKAVDGLRPAAGPDSPGRHATRPSGWRPPAGGRCCYEHSRATRSVKEILGRGLDRLPSSQPAEPSGQIAFRFQREQGYFDPAPHVELQMKEEPAWTTMILKPKLTRLKLSGILETLADRLEQAQGESGPTRSSSTSCSPTRWSGATTSSWCAGFARAGWTRRRPWRPSTSRFNPRIHEPTIRELATCQFLAESECCSSRSHRGRQEPPGSGHRQRGGPPRLRGALPPHLQPPAAGSLPGEGDGSHERRLKQLASVPVLILDDFG